MYFFLSLTILLILERLFELRAAHRNTVRLIERGGREFGARHYPAIVVMHVAFFLSLVIEYRSWPHPLPAYWVIPFSIFVLAQSIRLWARRTMAGRWTSRVIVVPGERLIRRGPYARIPHPIYVAVALELFSLPLIFGLYYTCIVFSFLNAFMLVRIRIPVEEHALAWSQRPTDPDET